MANPSRICIACAVLLCTSFSSPVTSTAATRTPLPDPVAEFRQRVEAMNRLASPGYAKAASLAEVLRPRALEYTSQRLLPNVSTDPTSWESAPTSSTPSGATGATASSGSPQAGTTLISTQEIDGDGDGTVESRIVRAATFDTQGRLVRDASTHYEGTTVTLLRLTLLTYDAQGHLLEGVDDQDQFGNGTVESRFKQSLEYDQAGRNILLINEQSNPAAGTIATRETITHEYDAAGYLVKVVTDFDDGADGTVESRSTVTDTYDAQGRVIDELSTLDQGVDGTLERQSHWTFVRDARGNVVEFHDETDGVVTHDYHTVTVYDSRSRNVLETRELDLGSNGTVDSRTTIEVTYDGRGNPVLEVYTTVQGGATDVTTFESTFDAQGRVVQQVTSGTLNGTLLSVVESSTTYDARGNVVKSVLTHDFGGDGTIETRTESTAEYNSRGDATRLVLSVDTNGDETIDLTFTDTITYDPTGNLLGSVSERDDDADGTVDYRTTTTIQYRRGMEEPVLLEDTRPHALQLRQAAPNPFQDVASLGFSLPVEGDVELRIFDASGRLVRDLVNGTRPAGDHQVSWDGRDDRARAVPNGAYFARLKAAGRVTTRTILRAR